ncbi:MAG: type II toxin-antitoxin system VapC family toxin [Comamonadaceae bacterium]|nr:type II toxin-antitoxin system VapC family toxin [Comamonadaceae bacterium]
MQMSGRYLLDTNVVISLFARNPATRERIAQAEEVFISCVVIGELYFGAYKSTRVQENIARIDDFVLNNSVLSCNADIAKRYGTIKNDLKGKGHPIPENDVWIAAIAQHHSLILVTNDVHFDAIEDLAVEKW